MQLDILFLDEVKPEGAWTDLVLPKGHKEMVQAMVQTHTSVARVDANKGPEIFNVDLIRGKGEIRTCCQRLLTLLIVAPLGRGCIILLHGAPGVGKTSTAGKSQDTYAGYATMLHLPYFGVSELG